MRQKRLMIWVQHLLGNGHLRRASLIARTAADAGMDVLLVSGGAPVPGMKIGKARLHQLPWCRAQDDSFKVLVDAQDNPVDDAFKKNRVQQLCDLARDFKPDGLITELFPLGRRQMRHEVLPLLDLVKSSFPDCVIMASFRDVLERKSDPARVAMMQGWAERYYDHFLVHGDPAITPLDTVMFSPAMIEKVHWTGYMVNKAHAGPVMRPDDAEILVSAGSGATGSLLLETAMQARLDGLLVNRPWRFLIGSAAPEGEQARLQAMAAGQADIHIEPARPDFPALLGQCYLSISQGGYNTALETLVGGCRALVVPFDGGTETEQTRRTRLLAGRSNIDVLPSGNLTAANLAAAVNDLAGKTLRSLEVDINGMEKCPEILCKLL